MLVSIRMVDRPPSTVTKHDLPALLIIFVVVTLAFFDVLFMGRGFYLRDLTSVYFPMKSLVRDALLSGELPYWNRAYGAGQPMAANPEYEIFYPPQLLILIGPVDFGFRLHILFHLYLAGATMYLLLRSLSATRAASIFGALSFVFGGLILSTISLLPLLFPMAWMPLLIWCSRRAFHAPSAPTIAAASMTLGMIGLVGEPVSFLISLLLLFGVGTYYLVKVRGAGWKGSLATTGIVVAAALAIASVQIVPAWGHLKDSVRSRGITDQTGTFWSLPLARPLELFFPNLFGANDPQHSVFQMSRIYPVEGVPYFYSIYPGLVVILLFAAAVSLRKKGSTLCLLATSISLLLAFGAHTPLWSMKRVIPVLSSLRYSEKFVMVPALIIPILAAMAWSAILGGDEALRKRGLVLACAFSLVSGSIFLATLRLPDGKGADFLRAGFLAAGLVLVLLIVPSRPRVATGLMTILLLADLLSLSRSITPTFPRGFFNEMPPLAREIRSDRYRIFHEAAWFEKTPLGRPYLLDPVGRHWMWRNGVFPITGNGWGVQSVLDQDIDQTLLLNSTDFLNTAIALRRQNDESGLEKLLSMSNVKWRAYYRPFEMVARESGGSIEDSVPVVFRPRGTNERYYFADRIVTSRNPEEMVAALQVGTARSAFADLPARTPASGIVRKITERPNSAEVLVDVSPGTGFLVASVTAHRYWSAAIDGTPVQIHTTNMAYQGLAVSQGRHRITFRYRNPLIDICGVISGLSVLLVLSLMVFFPVRLAGQEEKNSQ
ncbi:MAG TPA: YfhO family protein [Thermoanaerobaculia bacterium]|nr:YfhO family protein [Thermoanaerobaculia bacterium]